MEKIDVNAADPFRAVLSPEARAMTENLVTEAHPKGPNFLHLVTFMKSALWPIKEWYHHTAGRFFNRLVEDGVVKSVLGCGSMEMASGGRICVDLKGYRDCGPDHYGVIFVFFHSTLTPAELNEKYHVHCFENEGQVNVRIPNWWDIAPREESLVEYIKKQRLGEGVTRWIEDESSKMMMDGKVPRRVYLGKDVYEQWEAHVKSLSVVRRIDPSDARHCVMAVPTAGEIEVIVTDILGEMRLEPLVTEHAPACPGRPEYKGICNCGFTAEVR